MAVYGCTERCQTDAVGVPAEDLIAQFVLQVFHRGRKRGTGDVHPFGGNIHTAALDNFNQLFQLFDFHGKALPLSEDITGTNKTIIILKIKEKQV